MNPFIHALSDRQLITYRTNLKKSSEELSKLTPNERMRQKEELRDVEIVLRERGILK